MRPRLVMTTIVSAAVASLFGQGPASAGGTHVEVGRPYHAQGSTMTVVAQGFGTLTEPQRRAGPYYAFVVPGDGYADRAAIRAAGARLGRVVIRGTSPSGSWAGWASATVSLASLEPGPYGVHFCNDPCRDLFPVIAGSFTVTATADEARFLNEASVLLARARRSDQGLARSWQHRLERMIGRVEDSLTAVRDEIDERIESLESELATLRALLDRSQAARAGDADRAEGQPPGGLAVPMWLGGVLLVLVAAGAFLMGSRFRRTTVTRPGIGERKPSTPTEDLPLEDLVDTRR